MNVTAKVLGLTVAGVLVIALYLCGSVFGSIFGSTNPFGFMIYLGLILTAVFLAVIMYLASTGDAEA